MKWFQPLCWLSRSKVGFLLIAFLGFSSSLYLMLPVGYLHRTGRNSIFLLCVLFHDEVEQNLYDTSSSSALNFGRDGSELPKIMMRPCFWLVHHSTDTLVRVQLLQLVKHSLGWAETTCRLHWVAWHLNFTDCCFKRQTVATLINLEAVQKKASRGFPYK